MRPVRFNVVATAVAALLCSSAAGLCAVHGREAADGPKLTLDAKPAYSVLKAGEKQQTWMRIGLTGFHQEKSGPRPPLNVAIVLDRSGSMQGDKIAKARDAAIGALDLLKPTDIVSVIAYDSSVNVLVPATRLTDKEQVASVIRGIQANGNTALFGGVSKGAAEVRKFLDDRHVNRIILLSDGLANVGPSAPGELGSLGASLKKENITVSTLGLGLGYNEDLMVQLAGKSGGNHQFIENATELVDIFRREFDETLSVVAQEVDLKIQIPEGIRPVRVLGNSADINGQTVVTRLAQVYSDQQKHVVIEVEIPESLAVAATEAADAANSVPLATVEVTYTNMASNRSDSVSGTVTVKFSSSDDQVKASLDSSVMADVVALVASEQSRLATELLDQGDIAGCRRTLQQNVDFLSTNADLFNSPKLETSAEWYRFQLKELEGVSSNSAPGAVRARKVARDYELKTEQQATSASSPPKP